MADYRERVRAIIAETLGLDVAQVGDDRDIYADLNADDLDRLEIVLAIEAEFGIELTEDEFEDCRTPDDFIRCLDRVTGAANVA